MIYKVITAGIALLSLLLSSSSIFAQNLKCEIGPLQKQYGGTNWFVYACDDNKSVVFVTAPDNPALPFYFIYFPKNGTYTLSGEGSGNKDATKAAFDELREMPLEDIQRLIAEANNT